MSRIIAISNQKGGVGKTTTAINLSAALAHFNRKVLLIDMDPQGNASRGFGFDIALINHCIFDVLTSAYDINRTIKKIPAVKNLEIIPSKLMLASIDESLSSNDDKFFLLKNAINKLNVSYDYIIIDCPPSLGTLTINSLVASNSILIPVQCEYFAMEAVSQILAIVSKIQQNFNKELGIEGFLMTMYDSKTVLATEVSMEIRGLFKENTFLTQIPRNISIPESNVRGIPVVTYRPSSSSALAYFSLAREVMDKEDR